MDLKRDTRAKEEQMTLVRNRLERLKLEEQKVRVCRGGVKIIFGSISVLTSSSSSKKRRRPTVALKKFLLAHETSALHHVSNSPINCHIHPRTCQKQSTALSRAAQIYKKRNEERRQQEQERKIAKEREVEAEITKRQIERLQREARVQLLSLIY